MALMFFSVHVYRMHLTYDYYTTSAAWWHVLRCKQKHPAFALLLFYYQHALVHSVQPQKTLAREWVLVV